MSDQVVRRPHPNVFTAAAEEYAMKSAEVALRRLHRDVAETLGVEVVPPRDRSKDHKETGET